MGQSLIAFDTNHIKQYVFGTNKLKEIRGASSILDRLNRVVMTQREKKYYDTQKIYANGGLGLFLVDSQQADKFGRYVQQEYKEATGGSVSVSYVTQALPKDFKLSDHIPDRLDLLQWMLEKEKREVHQLIALPSHPFIRLCSSCGVEYADAEIESKYLIHDPGETDDLYCESCHKKRIQDKDVKDLITDFTKYGKRLKDAENKEQLWGTILTRLSELGYDFSDKPQRPDNFNVFRNFKGAKDYLGLIYADGNNMGRAFAQLTTLPQRKALAKTIDGAIYEAVCQAIVKHLQVADHLKPKEQLADDLKHAVFPFDILLLGGDDVLMVVPASVALDVALTIAEEFHELTKGNPALPADMEPTLSAGVVLAPVKYPFGLLRTMAESTLKYAKKAGAEARAKAKEEDKGRKVDDTRINFLIVTGGSSSEFKTIYEKTYHRKYEKPYQEFIATLRPYTPDDLHFLLKAIREGNKLRLGRTKLHQLREAVLQMNLTTSVIDALALLANWRDKERSHVAHQVYEFGGRCQMQHSKPDELVFPRVTFPWFIDDTGKEKNVYRTSLLDFVELYDFISKDTEDSSGEN